MGRNFWFEVEEELLTSEYFQSVKSVSHINGLAYTLAKLSQRGTPLNKATKKVFGMLKDVKDEKSFYDGITIMQVN